MLINAFKAHLYIESFFHKDYPTNITTLEERYIIGGDKAFQTALYILEDELKSPSLSIEPRPEKIEIEQLPGHRSIFSYKMRYFYLRCSVEPITIEV